MYTECPTCNTLFRVSPAQLRAAAGKVRCGECLAVFDAREYLREDLKTPAESAPVPERPKAPPGEEQPHLPRQVSPERESRTGATASEPPVPQPAPTAVHKAAHVSALPFAAVPQTKRSSRGWALLSGALLLTFLGQYLWFNRVSLMGIAALRPVMESLCRVADCPPASHRDPGVFELTGRGVQTHPAYQGALLIDATFVNRGELPSAYPELELVFTDPEGTPLASRRFLPVEYLGQEPQQPLAPGAEAHVVLELLDPGDLAVGYEFRFF